MGKVKNQKEELRNGSKLARIIFTHANIPRHIANHCLGHDHPIEHRRTIGGVVMIIGVIIAYFAGEAHVILLSLPGHLIGASLHGAGLVPFLEKEKKTEDYEES